MLARTCACVPRRGVSALVAVILMPVTTAHAQSCVSHPGEVRYGHLSGLRIDSIVVEPSAPILPGFVEPLTRHLHARTRATTVRRLFRQDVGGLVDTLRLAEAMRGLQRSALFSSVGLDTRECRATGTVRLTLRTVDAWSVRGGLHLGRDRGAASLGEDNLFGSGRAVRTSFRVDQGQPGFGVAYVDPWLMGSDLSLSLRRDVYRTGSELRAGVSTAWHSVLDPWRGGFVVGQSTRRSLVNVGDRVNRMTVQGIAERRAHVEANAVVSLGVGYEHASAELVTGPAARLVGPANVTRSFTGVTFAATRRSLAFASRVVLPGSRSRVELPTAVEADVAVSVGGDGVTGLRTQHVDAWIGKLWPLWGGGIVSASGWYSGFRDATGWSAGDGRVSLLALAPTRHGEWSVHLTSETLADPDPDTRTLLTEDPAARLFPVRGLAETIDLVSMEHDRRLFGVGRSYTLGGALFTSASRRFDLAGAEGKGSQGVFVVGTGVRLLPTRVGRATLRLDLAVPVGGGPYAHRPFISFSVSPWFEHERHRPGRLTP